MQKIEYASLKYYNSLISEECLYIGMIFNNLDTKERNFKYISNFKRLQSFDDEIDISFVKMYLKGIKEQIENNLFNISFSMKDFNKIFVNEFKFTEISIIEVDDDDNYVENLSKIYLKYDYSKNNRLSNNEERKYLKKILSSGGFQLLNSKIDGLYCENITFDYVLKDTAIKFFSFKNKDLKKLIPAAKQWSFTADEIKDKTEVIFIYDEKMDNDDFTTLINILKKNGKVFDFSNGLEYLQTKRSI